MKDAGLRNQQLSQHAGCAKQKVLYVFATQRATGSKKSQQWAKSKVKRWDIIKIHVIFSPFVYLFQVEIKDVSDSGIKNVILFLFFQNLLVQRETQGRGEGEGLICSWGNLMLIKSQECHIHWHYSAEALRVGQAWREPAVMRESSVFTPLWRSGKASLTKPWSWR